MKRAATLLVIAGMLLTIPAQGARAHALLRSSTPADGAETANAPDAVTLTFTEQPEVSLTIVHVLDQSGNTFEAGKPQPVDRRTVRVAVKRLPNGIYTVTWRTVSRTDGHNTAGSFAFGVNVAVTPGARANAPAPKTPPASKLEMVGRALFLAGLIAVLGAAWIALFVFGRAPPSLRRLATICCSVGVAGLLVFAEAQRRAAGVGISTLLGTAVGRSLIWRAAGVAVAGVAIAVARRFERLGMLVALIAAAGALFAHVDAGHAAASGSWTVAKDVAQWVHVVAVGIWIGGLLALLVGIRGTVSDEKARAVRRFSFVAAFALLVVAGSGTLRAFEQITQWRGLWSSAYGVTVLIKAGLILGLAGLGAVNRYRSVPVAHEDLTLLRRIATSEVCVGIAAIAAAAVLASVAPPAPASLVARAQGVVVTGADLGTTTRARLVIAPGTPGPGTFTLKLTDFDTNAPVDADAVTLRFSFQDPSVGSSTLAMTPSSPGTYTATGTNVSLAGTWQIVVGVQRGNESVEIPLTFATTCDTTSIVTPGLPTIYAATYEGGSMQGYTDPSRAGFDQVHATFFDARGNEQAVDSTTMSASAPGGARSSLQPRRLSQGHFVADAQLTRGMWRFDIVARAGSQTIRTCFESQIG
ncbi:MAG: copper resistance CopC/CopD family protein [Actinomycetota bacterium]